MAPQSLSPSPILAPTPSPYTTAPSSPRLLGYSSDDDSPDSEIELLDSVCSFIPFNWEEKPGKPKSFRFAAGGDEVDDIAFEFRADRLERISIPADELFDGGKIKPLKPPPRLQLESAGISESTAPISGRKSFVWSSRWNYGLVDPFEAAIESARRGDGVSESESDETASFAGSSRLQRLKNLFPFGRVSSEGSGSGSGSSSGSVSEPDHGCEDGGRRMPLCRPRLFSCFMESL